MLAGGRCPFQGLCPLDVLIVIVDIIKKSLNITNFFINLNSGSSYILVLNVPPLFFSSNSIKSITLKFWSVKLIKS